MNLLAFDAASRTGWASRVDGVVSYGCVDILSLCSKKPTRGEKLAAAQRAYSELVARVKPDLVLLEAPFGRGTGTRLLYGFAAAVEAAAHDGGAACLELEPSAVRLRVLGSGRLANGKADVISWARAQGYKVSDDEDDEADALLLLHAGFAAVAKPAKTVRKKAA